MLLFVDYVCVFIRNVFIPLFFVFPPRGLHAAQIRRSFGRSVRRVILKKAATMKMMKMCGTKTEVSARSYFPPTSKCAAVVNLLGVYFLIVRDKSTMACSTTIRPSYLPPLLYSFWGAATCSLGDVEPTVAEWRARASAWRTARTL